MSNENHLPLGRQILRGFSQCAFQANEITGACFIVAAAVFSWRMAAFYVIAVVIGTIVARLLKGIPDLLDLGLYGFNSGLIGLALGNFFEPVPMLWLWVAVFAAVAAALAVAMSKWVPFPFLAAPFILTFWAIWPLASTLGITPIEFGPFAKIPVNLGSSIIVAAGAALFIPKLITGAIFLAGVAWSNWRHALIALLGAFIANALALHVGVAGEAIASGFVGFNGVLAALAGYALIASDLRLAILASLLATWLASYIFHGLALPVLASGFVLAIWFILALGWLSPRFASKPAAA
jgi:urea transporter